MNINISYLNPLMGSADTADSYSIKYFIGNTFMMPAELFAEQFAPIPEIDDIPIEKEKHFGENISEVVNAFRSIKNIGK